MSTESGFLLSTNFKIISSWNSGFEVHITLSNNSSTPTTSWRCSFELAPNHFLSSQWECTLVNDNASKNKITVTNPTWIGGGVISPGKSATFGMIVQTNETINTTISNLQAKGYSNMELKSTNTSNQLKMEHSHSESNLTAPVLTPVNNSGNFRFTISWSPVKDANAYQLLECDEKTMAHPLVVYTGSNLSVKMKARQKKTYFYAVIACQGTKQSPKSNVIEIQITQMPLPPKAFIEGYWESWNSKEPVDLIVGMNVDVIDVSFATLKLSKNEYHITGVECNETDLANLISTAHQIGKKVKLSIGGATYPLSSLLTSPTNIQGMANAYSHYVKLHKFDGIDFDIEDYPPANLQIGLIQNVRQLLGPQYLVSYTAKTPASSTQPYTDILRGAHQYLNTINLMAYDAGPDYSYKTDIQSLISMGIPASKIVLGLMPGYDDMKKMTSLKDVVDACNYIVSNRLPGLMYWDMNRDHENLTGLGIDATANTAFAIFNGLN